MSRVSPPPRTLRFDSSVFRPVVTRAPPRHASRRHKHVAVSARRPRYAVVPNSRVAKVVNVNEKVSKLSGGA